MMPTEAELFDLISSIYDAALSPDRLPEVMSRVGDLCRAPLILLGAVPKNSRRPTLLVRSRAVDPGLFDRFLQDYTTPETNPAMVHFMREGHGRFVRREEAYSDQTWERSGIYNEIYRPMDGYHGGGTLLLNSDQYFVHLGASRSKRKDSFSNSEVALFARVLPHLRRALQTLLRMHHLQAQTSIQENLWDRLSVGVILVDPSGTLLWCNRKADMILTAGAILRYTRGALSAPRTKETKELHRLINDAAQCAAGRGARTGGQVAIAGPDGVPWSVLVSPFRPEVMPIPVVPAVAVLISDPRESAAPLDHLASFFGLTNKELEIARLLTAGHDLPQIGEQLDMRINTVRTHLRSLFAKTNTNRQAELVALLLRVTGTSVR
jgi:DNA-binding CsgD family transcriptional regulator